MHALIPVLIQVKATSQDTPYAFGRKWLPFAAYQLQADEGNRYAQWKISAKDTASTKLDKVDAAWLRLGGFSAASCEAYYRIRLVLHGLHNVNYNIKDCWKKSKTKGIGFVNAGDLMPLDFYLAHGRCAPTLLV